MSFGVNPVNLEDTLFVIFGFSSSYPGDFFYYG
ncbi:hypothetical protein GGR41_000868 [Paenalcaligenes hominis]|uniref:Uncharacterized protein n=1 Tax=Paenalcaligenes hominis TaxID=643674 RepID=A0ABX0WPC4_9BURK|nr:hypothetical protein [Paenalcaligenes hominis]